MFYFNKGSLDIGNEWSDRTMVLLTVDNQSIAITNNKRIPYGMTFDDFCVKEFEELSNQLTEYQEFKRENKEISGLNAVFSEFFWKSPKGNFHQLLLIIDSKDNIPIFLTCTNVGKMTEGQKSRFISIMESFKFRT